MREDFERDGTKPNPYEEPETCKLLRIRFRLSLYLFRITVVTIKSLRHQLDKDDARKLREGHVPPHTVTSGVFIGNAIQIEEQQYVPHHVKPVYAADFIRLDLICGSN